MVTAAQLVPESDIYSEEKVKSVQTMCAIILLDYRNIDKKPYST